MNSTKSQVGERLKSIRQSRSLSLDEVSKLTGVSKPMIGQIERGQSSPTINTLWKIATGLKIPLSSFMEGFNSEYKVIDIEKIKHISEENEHMRAYTIFPYDPIRNFEMFYIEFDSGCIHRSEGHLSGVEECVFVMQGKIGLSINNETVILEKNQIIRFQANTDHCYSNPYNEKCVVQNIIFYP